jgi:hypothetical protein
MSQTWAITCLFNPAGYRIRTENYHRFRAALPVPLVTVELSFDGQFALEEGDADILVQINGGAKLWQKERLLNIAVQRLPKECDKVLVLDADIVGFDNVSVRRIESLLDDHMFVHPYQTVRHRTADERDFVMIQESILSHLDRSTDLAAILLPTRLQGDVAAAIGHAWAVRRELIEVLPIYDRSIVGGGDTAFLCAMLNQPEAVIQLHGMSEAHAEDYRSWAEKANRFVQGRVSRADSVLDHLWHGTMVNRMSRKRHTILREQAYDPHTDIELGEYGAWNWTPQGQRFAEPIEQYFHHRAEDQVEVKS